MSEAIVEKEIIIKDPNKLLEIYGKIKSQKQPCIVGIENIKKAEEILKENIKNLINCKDLSNEERRNNISYFYVNLFKYFYAFESNKVRKIIKKVSKKLITNKHFDKKMVFSILLTKSTIMTESLCRKKREDFYTDEIVKTFNCFKGILLLKEKVKKLTDKKETQEELYKHFAPIFLKIEKYLEDDTKINDNTKKEFRKAYKNFYRFLNFAEIIPIEEIEFMDSSKNLPKSSEVSIEIEEYEIESEVKSQNSNTFDNLSETISIEEMEFEDSSENLSKSSEASTETEGHKSFIKTH